jgi:hypothetical protein
MLLAAWDLALRHQSANKILALGLPQISRYASFVTGANLPPQRKIAAAPYPHWIALAGRFDLDDIGPHIGHQLPTKRSGDQLPELDHPDISQRSFGLGSGGHSILLFTSGEGTAR